GSFYDRSIGGFGYPCYYGSIRFWAS
ncbi:hypothetical protein, partial [uncultured Gammaproteobacteria bacterium]